MPIKSAVSAVAVALLLASCAPYAPAAPTTPKSYTNEGIQGAVPITGVGAQEVRIASAKVLFWPEAERSANFRAMDTLFPVTTVRPATKARALPLGAPLIGIDEATIRAEMAARRVIERRGEPWREVRRVPAGRGAQVRPEGHLRVVRRIEFEQRL